MIIPLSPLASNPFFEAYTHADLLGKMIFLGLFVLSIVSWVLIIHKSRVAQAVKGLSSHFEEAFHRQQQHPLKVEYQHAPKKDIPHPFFDLYQLLRTQTLEILAKNRHFNHLRGNNEQESQTSFLSHTDMELVEAHLATEISSHNKNLESNLFILSTVVSLAPFLGLLGTVWGILTTFAELQAHTGGSTNQMVLHGLSLALATTVLGLLNAIPALIGYNYLRNRCKEYQTDMEAFANRMLSTVELHYRQVDTL